MKTKTIHISQKLEKFGIFFGLSLIILMIILAIFAPVISPHDPLEINIQNKMAAASPDYPFGTDNLGRCIFSRVLYGARYSLTYAGILLAIMLAISIPLGLLCGYIGGKFDLIVMGIADAVMAFPNCCFGCRRFIRSQRSKSYSCTFLCLVGKLYASHSRNDT